MLFSALSAIPDVVGNNTEPNAGGIALLRLVAADLLKVLVHPSRFPIHAQSGYPAYTLTGQHLSFKPEARLVDVSVLPEYCSFSEPTEDTPNGLLYKPALTIMLPKVRPDIVDWVATYGNVRWVAFFQDRNGLNRMAGLPEYPLQIALNLGQDAGKGRNQTTLTFSGQSNRPAYLVNSIDAADLLYAGPFDTGFGFGFDA